MAAFVYPILINNKNAGGRWTQLTSIRRNRLITKAAWSS